MIAHTTVVTGDGGDMELPTDSARVKGSMLCALFLVATCNLDLLREPGPCSVRILTAPRFSAKPSFSTWEKAGSMSDVKVVIRISLNSDTVRMGEHIHPYGILVCSIPMNNHVLSEDPQGRSFPSPAGSTGSQRIPERAH